MPDRDLFTRHLPAAWWQAGRSVYAYCNDDEVMIKRLVQSLWKFSDECPGISEITDITLTAVDSGLSEISYREAVDRLVRVKRLSTDRRTCHVGAAARGFLDEWLRNPSGYRGEKVSRTQVASHILARVAIAQVSCSPSFLCKIADSQGVDVQIVLDRQHHVLDLLQASPHLKRLARNVLSESGQRPLKRLRIPIAQFSQDELVYLPISS